MTGYTPGHSGMTTPLTVETPWGLVSLPALRCLLPDGRIGWYQRGMNDCLTACIATVTQAHYEDVPQGANDSTAADLAAWEALWTWAGERGLRMRFHSEPPDSEFWIGVEPKGEDGYRHTIVAKHDQPYFDPASGFQLPPGHRIATVDAIEYAISLEPKEHHDNRS